MTNENLMREQIENLERQVLVHQKLQKELTEVNDHLRFENLKMRLDFEALLDIKLNARAEKILKRYRRKRELRKEVEQALRN